MTMNEQFCYIAQDWHFHCSLLFVMNREGTAQQAILYHSVHEEHWIMGVPSLIIRQTQ